jgi:hypothetical protein
VVSTFTIDVFFLVINHDLEDSKGKTISNLKGIILIRKVLKQLLTKIDVGQKTFGKFLVMVS